VSSYICENRVETPLKATPGCEKEDLPTLLFFTSLVAYGITDSTPLVATYYFSEQRGTHADENSICLNKKWPRSLGIQLFC
jgi:hypothetical protein